MHAKPVTAIMRLQRRTWNWSRMRKKRTIKRKLIIQKPVLNQRMSKKRKRKSPLKRNLLLVVWH